MGVRRGPASEAQELYLDHSEPRPIREKIPENPKYQSIKVTEENELIIWGVVTYVVKKL